jgi:hypothetical protein
MRTLVVATAFAAVALVAQSASACDWNREASTEQQVVATTAPSAPASQTTSTATQTPTVTADTSKPAEPTAPVVLVNDRH